MNVLLFGITKEIVGDSPLHISVESNVKNVRQLRSFLLKEYPKLQELSSLAIAVNNKYAQEDDNITIDDEIALIPPVSGG
ncbi:molybdopterin converting factor subunit 1 [Joostella atrarenae]|uniref:Molybdopterin synthase sulfur carrier subunit n=1 Tax=Joostella atrarenae TaxID=679257 RepID=A0ABS9J0M1_9FLAO|nr:molybdopterin converting factor subunit 1 [Joostella atrarenae]MCF8713979.1 molybdopterin converting factor subunit 1 [Joostella atrarenae]